MKIHSVKKSKRKRDDSHFSGRSLLLRMFLMLLLCIGSVFMSYAQNTKTVTGKVSEVNGEPVMGANVTIAGTIIGTATDTNGNFTLQASEKDVLVVSYLGYVTKQIPIGTNSRFEITLEEDLQKLDEVVVVGYGTQKKATLSGSVVAIDNKELVTTKNTNVQNMLTGKLPGVRNIQKTSEPGQFTNQFDIRGMGDALLVVDGVPRGDFPRMDPNDIESISVLKDASAAIYGIKGGNGVILITTKSGEKGKAKIEYSGFYGIQVPAEMLQPLNAWNRALLYNETTMRSTSNPVKEYGEDYFERLKNGEAADTDWYAALMRDTAPQQQHNVSVTGGSDKVDYYVNLGYTDQGSFWITNSANYDRYNLRTNLNAQITNRLKASIKLNMIMDETNRQNMSSWEVFKMLWRSKPNDPIYANGTEPYYFHPAVEFNPLPSIMPDLSGYVKDKKNMFQSNMGLEYTVPYIKGLKAQFMFSYDKTYNDNTNYKSEYNEYNYNAANDTYSPYLRNSKTQLTRYFSNSYTTLWNARLNYDNTFGLHHVGVLALYEEIHNVGYNFSALRYFDIPNTYFDAGSDVNQSISGPGPSESANKSLVGRLNYDFAGKYLLEASLRYDGSSKFRGNKQWSLNPSVSLGYRISEESFIKNNFEFVNNLKIRGSWGQVADESSASYQYLEGYDYPIPSNLNPNPYDKTKIPKGYVFGSTFVKGLGFRNAPNLDLTWSTNTMKNIGLDADLWNRLFGFSVDLFQRDRDGLLEYPNVVVPATFGSGISQANLNADRTKGFEVELRHYNRIGDFNYNVTGYVSMTRNMWTKRIQPDRSNSYDYWRNNLVNRYNDIWFGRGDGGIFQSWNDIANSLYTSTGTLPGDPIYEDWNGDGYIDDVDMHPIATTTSNDGGRLPNANTNDARNYPLMNFGLTLGGSWKWIDFNFLFQGAAMSYIGYGEQLLNPLTWDGNALDMLFDRWHPENPDIDPYDPSLTWISGNYPYGKTRAAENSAYNMQNGAYLRLKSAELGFTVPKNFGLNKLGVKNIRLFVNAYNLLTFTGVKSVDPEKPSETYGYLYPLNRTFNFGGTITF